MATYFDNREGREKSLPDCSKVGCVWDAVSQRCEIMSYRNSQSFRPGLGFLGNAEDEFSSDSEDCYSDGWCFDGYGWYDQGGGYYDPNTDSYFDPDSGEWLGGDANYYGGDFTEDDSGNWRFVDGAGNISEGGADGSLHEFDADTGEEIFISADGEYTWMNSTGDSYTVNAQGDWTSTSADGLVCNGDASGNGSCNDGTVYSASGGRPSPIRDAAEAKRAASAGGGQSSGSPGSAAKKDAQQKAATNPGANRNPNQPLFSKADMQNLIYLGLGFGALVLLSKK